MMPRTRLRNSSIYRGYRFRYRFTSLSSGSGYKNSQRWSKAWRDHPEKPDGIYSRSRHDPSRTAWTLYDRAGMTIRCFWRGFWVTTISALRIFPTRMRRLCSRRAMMNSMRPPEIPGASAAPPTPPNLPQPALDNLPRRVHNRLHSGRAPAISLIAEPHTEAVTALC